MTTRILLVEDNELSADMLSRRLQRRGFEVVCASDGQAAVALAVSKRPDLVLMDMSLPVLDGWEATRRIRSAESAKRIPIIALTAHALADDAKRAIDVGCDDYDSKPVDLERLLGKIERALANRANMPE